MSKNGYDNLVHAPRIELERIMSSYHWSGNQRRMDNGIKTVMRKAKEMELNWNFKEDMQKWGEKMWWEDKMFKLWKTQKEMIKRKVGAHQRHCEALGDKNGKCAQFPALFLIGTMLNFHS